ncbi:MAG: Calx-beta domain-containing protein [Panacagrimonas sp.]
MQIAFDDTQARYPVTVDPLLVSEEEKVTVEGDGSVGQEFGFSVSIDGNTMIVGRPETGSFPSGLGSAFIFTRSGSVWTQQAKLTVPDLKTGAEFGFSVAVSGDTAVVGTTKAAGGSSNSDRNGSVFVFVRSSGIWNQQAQLRASDGAPGGSGNRFGKAVAISGERVVVGSNRAAYVFLRSAGTWTEEVKLGPDIVGGFTNFGFSVAISGDTLLVGAPGDANGVGGAYVFVRSGTSWSQQAKLTASDRTFLDSLGSSVALSGNTALIGAPEDDLTSFDDNRGSAYAFVRSGSTWSQQRKFIAPDPTNGSFFGDQFGKSVAIAGNTALIGAPGHSGSGSSGDGAGYVFVRSGTSWGQQTKLVPNDAQGFEFGRAVALSGETAAVGAPRSGNADGFTFAFVRSGSTWSRQAKLTALNDGATNDSFGAAIAIDGDTLVISAPFDDTDGDPTRDSVFVFRHSGGIWAQEARLIASSQTLGLSLSVSGDTIIAGTFLGQAHIFVRNASGWTEQAALDCPGCDGFSTGFGQSVAISGNTVVVGANGQGFTSLGLSGAAYVFSRSGASWTYGKKLEATTPAAEDMFGNAVAISNDLILVGSPGENVGANAFQGAAHVFTRIGSDWVETARLTAADGVAQDQFGVVIALNGRIAAVAAVNGGSASSGSAYIFERDSVTWSQQAKLVANDGALSDQFGGALSLSDNAIAVGAPGDDIGSNLDQGSAYIFLRSGTSWSQQAKVVASDGAEEDRYGQALALSGNTVFVGSPNDDNSSGSNAGAAYGYRIAADYGDAPDPTYPTLLANDGARHFINGPKLGTAIDAETDGQPNSGATGDDIAGIDDEDGVEFGTLSAGQSATVNVEVTGGPALLDAWVDFNRDGDWADAGEQIFDDHIVLDGANDGLVFQVPAGAVSGISYARVRLSSNGVADVTGAAGDGEVEDELVTISAATLSVADASVSETNSGSTNLSFTVSLSSASASSVSVNYATANGTATLADADYAAASGTLEFTPGQISKTVTVPVNGDTKFELDETLTLVLSSPVGASISDGSATGTILNDDQRPSISFVPATASALESAGTLSFTLELSNPSYETVTVQQLSVFGGTANASDYSGLTASPFTFAPGTTSKTVNLTIVDDATDEPDETVILVVGSITNATAGNNALTLTIQDNDGAPTVSFVDATLSFDEAAGTVTSRIQLSAASGQSVSVPVTVTGGTAGAADFALLSASPVTIPAGATFVDLSLQITNDLLDEADETISLMLGTPTNATVTVPLTQTLTITDNDATPTVSFEMAGASYDEAAGTVMIPVRLSAASGQLVTAAFSVGGSATAADFSTPTTTPLSFPPGSTAVNIVLSITNDLLDEVNETVVFTLGAVSNATLGTIPGFTATIADNDNPPTVAFEMSSRSVLESAGTVSVDLVLSAASSQNVSVSFGSGGTAGAADFSGLTASPVTIPAGSTRATLSLSVTDDMLDEPDETLSLTLTSATNASLGTPAGFTLTIQDNDNPPTVSFTTAAQSADEADGTVSATVQLSSASAFEVTVPVLVSGTAGGSDFTLLSATPVVIPAGATQATVSVNLLDDALDEDAETIAISLQPATNATVAAPSTHTITIADNDNAPTVAFEMAARSVLENAGTVSVDVVLSAVSGKSVSVSFGSGGSAGAADFSGLTASPVTIAAGATRATLSVTITNDALDEPEETLLLSLLSALNASVAAPSGFTLTIQDNDNAPTVSFTTAAQSVSESAGTVTAVAQLSAPSGFDVSLPFSLSGTAGGTDFTLMSASPLVILAGATQATVSVSLLDDALDEDDETVAISLLAATNATVAAPSTHTITIQDNDNAPTLSFTVAAQSASESAGTVSAIAQLSGPSAFDVTVPFTVSGSVGASDFTLLSASPLVIPAGSIQATLSVSLLDDALDEAAETIALNLQTATNASVIAPSTHTITIQDNDNTPTVAFNLAASSVNENAGTVMVGFNLSAASGLPVTVPFSASGALGANGATVGTSSPVVIPAGSVAGMVAVTIANDTLDEFDQLLTLTLSAPTNATLGAQPQHALTILDNDAAPSVRFSVGMQNVGEAAGSASLALQLSAVSGKPITVPLSFGGTASKPGDYNASVSSVSIPAGSAGGSLSLSIVNDTAFESPNETVMVTAQSPTNASLGNPSAQTVTIVDDDAQAVSTITVAPATAAKLTLNQHCVTATTRDSVGTLLPNIPLSFAVTGVNPTTGAATTSGAGSAQFCFNGVNGGTDTIKASFMSVFGTASITWTKRNTTLKAEPVPAVIITQGLQIRIRFSPKATLKDSTTNTPIAGRSVNFKASDNTALCTATTNASGVATCQATVPNALRIVLGLGYRASFNGDASYNPSTAKGDVLGLKLF